MSRMKLSRTKLSHRAVVLSLILTATVAGLSLSLSVAKAQSAGEKPNYDKVDDFLNGGRHLLRDDDLAVTFTFRSASSELRQVMFTGGSSNSSANFQRFDNYAVIPEGQAGCDKKGGCYLDFHYYDFLNTATGRFFNIDRDTTVLYPFQFDNRNNPLLLSMAGKSISNAAGLILTTAQDVTFVSGGTQFKSYAADFNGDGYDDLLMAWSNPNVLPSNPRMVIATAVDVDDPGKGFKFGPIFTPAVPYAIRQATVGDFDGDGQPEIAQLYVDVNKNLTLATYGVDPETLTISEGGQVVYFKTADTGYHPLEMAAGHFTNLGHQQLVVGAQLTDGAQVHMGFFDFDKDSIQPKRVKSVFFPDAAQGMTLRLRTGRFNWSNPYDQIAWMSSSGAGTRMSVLTVDPQSQEVIRKADTLITDIIGQKDAINIGFDIAVGNFDAMRPSAINPSENERDPNLQIALIGARYARQSFTAGTGAFYIFGVSSDYSTLTQKAGIYIPADFFGGNNILNMSIAAGDLQGRSYRLGRGTRLSIENYMQPSVITAVPPMHVDYVVPNGGTTPKVVNMSWTPDGFWTKYDVAKENNIETTTTDSVSHTFGFKQELNSHFTIGDPKENSGLEVKASVQATQDIKNSSQEGEGKFEGISSSFSQQTGTGDSVVYAGSTVHIWVYEALGRTICRPGTSTPTTDCKDSDKVPLTIQFSAPSDTSESVGTGSNEEFYQPIWEPGNIFSYPANLAQLQQSIDGTLDLLNDISRSYRTDSSAAVVNTTWRSGVNSNSTIGQNRTFSGSATLSISGQIGRKGVGSIGAGLSFNAYGSDAYQNLTQTTGKFNQSTGITLNKPGFFNAAAYGYTFTPYIFGSKQSPGFVDNVDLNTDLQLFGALQTAFTVDLTGPGKWWSVGYTKPDIALNHPLRWSFVPVGLPRDSNPVIPSQCVPVGDGRSMNCATLSYSPPNRPDGSPQNPWGDEFHFMRGFLITEKDFPGKGPQIQVTQDGTTLRLQTRVYNYSLMPLPADSRVFVRFYGIPWRVSPDGSNPANSPAGDIFQIGQDIQLGAIPPYSSAPNAPVNWSIASVHWDTTGLGNKFFTFAVVAWAQASDGTLVAEMPGHGLNATPGAAGSYKTFADLAALEELVLNPLPGQLVTPDLEMVSFSNNIGFYNLPLYVQPAGTQATFSDAGVLTMGAVKTAANDIAQGQTIKVSAQFNNGSQPLSGVTVYFYDGDPAAGGRAFDVERIPYIQANASYEVDVNYHARTCGAHRLFLRAGDGNAYQVSGQSQVVQVECAAPVCVSQVCMRSPQYYALHLDRLPKGVVSVGGNALNATVSTSDTTKMGLLLNGGTSRQDQLNQQYVATQLSLLAQTGFAQTSLQSNLLCYNLNFQPTPLSTGFALNPSMTIGGLFTQVQLAARAGTLADKRLLANLLQMLNGDDPTGRCK